MKSAAQSRAGTEPRRVVAVGDTIISEQGLVAIIGRDPRYHVCGAAHTFEEANKLVRQHRPDVLLIEPFLENRDAIRWILWYHGNPNGLMRSAPFVPEHPVTG